PKPQSHGGAVPNPPQLFSPSHQDTQWQTSIPDQPPGSGWGGRCADLLDTLNPRSGNQAVLSLCVSLAGANTFEVGGVVQQYSVSTGGVVSISNNFGSTAQQSGRSAALNTILGIDAIQSNMLTNNYALALQHSLSTGS